MEEAGGPSSVSFMDLLQQNSLKGAGSWLPQGRLASESPLSVPFSLFLPERGGERRGRLHHSGPIPNPLQVCSRNPKLGTADLD